MALAEHGEAGYAEMLEHQTRHGRGAAGVAGGERMADRELDAAAGCVLHARRAGAVQGCCRRCGSGRSHGCPRHSLAVYPVMRACITSFRTTAKDIEWVVER